MILPDRFYMVTRRCTQRQFLLCPGPDANQIFQYCLLESAIRWDITVLLPCVLSNHHHTVIYDRHGHVIEFIQHFHSLLARSMNAFRGRWENFFSTEEPCLVELVGRNDILDKLTYAATNPVKDGLVERVADWPGVNGLDALLSGRSVKVERPEKFFRDDGAMPRRVELTFHIPEGTRQIPDVAAFLAELRDSVTRAEAEFARQRAEHGKRVLGRRRILQQSWCDSPASHEPRRNRRPRVAARNTRSRIQALARNQAFINAYRKARKLWLAGLEAIFPAGTFWLRRFAAVQVANAPAVFSISN